MSQLSTITPKSGFGNDPISMPVNKIIEIFENFGVILFRNFEFKPENLSLFTDIYTEKYANDALRRKLRFGSKNIRNVDLGCHNVPLHSEGSYSIASCPEIIWFYCKTPPSSGGQTTICDGKELFKDLKAEVKQIFKNNQVVYELRIPAVQPRKLKGKQPFFSNSIGASGIIDWTTGILELKQKTYAVNIARDMKHLCFANHLLSVKYDNDPQVASKNLFFENGQKIKDEHYLHIKEKAADITYDHNWKQGDLLMIDNRRFMHGRRSVPKGVMRDIVIIQTMLASFAYGTSIRKSIKDNL